MSNKLLTAILVVMMLSVMVLSACAPAEEAPAAAPAKKAEAKEEAKEEEMAAPEIILAADMVLPPGKFTFQTPADVYSEKEIRIAEIMVQNNPFGLEVMKGYEWAAEALKDRNVTVDWISVPDFDPKKFEDAMRNVMTAQYDAVCLFGLSEALTPVVNEAVEQGMIVYSFNTEPGLESNRHAYWGQDGFAGGQMCGQALLDATGSEGKYAIITGSFNVLGHELRRTGARDVLDAVPAMVNVGEFENQDKSEEAYNVTQNLLVANPDLAAIYVTAGGPFGAAKAIQDAGKTGEVKLICHDWMAETIVYIRSGEVTACLDQDPFNQGAAPIVAAYNYLAAGIEPEEINWFEGDIATPENVSEMIPE
jgi:ribose transport system substrate-binding protein